jgi:hypothetical protein
LGGVRIASVLWLGASYLDSRSGNPSQDQGEEMKEQTLEEYREYVTHLVKQMKEQGQ